MSPNGDPRSTAEPPTLNAHLASHLCIFRARHGHPLVLAVTSPQIYREKVEDLFPRAVEPK